MKYNHNIVPLSPKALLTLIQKIELIPDRELGLLVSSESQLYTALKVFKEGYKNFEASEIITIYTCIKKMNCFMNIHRQYLDNSSGLNSKRNIIDYLYAYRLLLEPNNVIKTLVRNTRCIFNNEPKLPVDSFSPEVIKCLLSIYPKNYLLRNLVLSKEQKESLLKYASNFEKINKEDAVDWTFINEEDFKLMYETSIWKK